MTTLKQRQYREFNPEDNFKELVDTHNILNHELFSGGFSDILLNDLDKIYPRLVERDYIWITTDSEKLPIRCGITNKVEFLRNFIFRDDEKYVSIKYLLNDPSKYWAKKYKQELKRIIVHFRK